MGIETLSLLFAIALCAGIVDSMAGGGGLITLPALLMAGLTPAQAIATNKIQALFSVGSAASRFAWAGTVNFRSIWKKALASMVGAAIGAFLVQILNSHFLSRLAPALLIAVAVLFLFARQFAPEGGRQRISETAFALVAALPIGFYDGFFGPGTGAIYPATLVFLLGRSLEIATAQTKILNTVGSAIAAAIFLTGGAIVWRPALVMVFGAVLGGQIGAHIVLRWGAPLIRVALVIVSIALAIRLF
jgi:uncharacterized protein